MQKLILLFYSTLLLSSCVVTNNLYVNDPVPLKENKSIGYVGIGSGITPDVDSVSQDGYIYFSNKIRTAANLCVGGQMGLTDKLSGRASVHIPHLLGGFGLKLGTQYSAFDSSSLFNVAIGSDLGFVLSRDSTISFFGEDKTVNEGNYAKSAVNIDVFLPLSIRFTDESRIVFTPRYSMNTFFMKQHVLDEKSGYRFNAYFASITAGLFIKRLYLEASIQSFQDIYYPNFGIAYLFK